MNVQKIKIFIVVLIMTNSVQCIDPLTAAIGVGLGYGAKHIIEKMNSKKECSECCDPKCCVPNLDALSQNFDTYIHGQHLVKKIAIRALKGHVANDRTPKKALVMSFHGWTGGGKNYVAEFIADNLFNLGLESPNVHQFFSRVHFPDDDKAKIYKSNLQNWIRGNVTQCSRSLFIFDEIDKMPLGMMDCIKPFVDFPGKIDGVDYRRSIFLFLSNTGGAEITRFMIKSWENGQKREEISLEDMEVLIKKGVFNEIGGLHQSALIHHNLVDFYVPFLPLERKHVEKCVADEFLRKEHTPTKDLIKKVADQMQYYPPETRVYSTSGCKRVYQKVNYILADMEYD